MLNNLFSKQIFPDTRRMGGFGPVPNTAERVAAGGGGGRPIFGGHNWGRGHQLGGN